VSPRALRQGTPPRRRLIGAARLLKMIDQANRAGLPRVEIVRPDSWQPLGDAAVVMADANSCLHEASLPWTARADGCRVWIERDSR